MMIVFNDTLSAYGGSHTMMQRMCQWLSENGIHSAVLCKDDRNTEIVDKLKKFGTEIYKINVKDTPKIIVLLKKLQDREDGIKVIAFSVNMYLDLERAKAYAGLKFDNVLYCIQSESLKKGLGFRTNMMRNYSKKKYRSILSRINENNALIMMDEYCRDATIAYMGPIFITPPPIMRLPMYCNPLNTFEEIIERGYESRLIMTAARAEFPNKGYMLGLLDDFAQLKEKFSDVKLEIIAAGDDMSKLSARIDALPEYCRKDIIIKNWMSYDSLLEELKKCTIFIGMGSSVLDAALCYKPASAAKGYTYKNICPFLIYEEPRYVIASQDSTEPASYIIEKVLSMNISTYRETCLKCYKAVEETYGIERLMDGLIKHETIDKGCLLTSNERIMHWMNNKFNSIRYRKEAFNYNAIVKEK